MNTPGFTDAATALHRWLEQRLDGAGRQWLHDARAAVACAPTDRELFRSISLVSRKLGKSALAMEPASLAQARHLRPGWDPSDWTVDQAARVLLMLAAPGDADTFVRRLDQLCATADLDELVAFYRGLPLYPHAPRHRARAAEGVRSNMKVVFEAVAHRNPYPSEQLAEDAWNQMVLKALFVGSALDPVIGLDERANPPLARMLCDYAHERWAAGRALSPELWRCVGPHAQGPMLADLARVLQSGSGPERAAAILALRAAPGPDAAHLTQQHTALRDAVVARGIGWSNVFDFT